MVRNYVRKSQRGEGYTRETLNTALEAVKSGHLTIYRASLVYNIPKNTLTDHVKGRRGQKSSSYGRSTDIPLEQETVLANGIRCMEKWGFGLCRKDILELVGDYVKINKMKTQFKHGIPGEDWFLKFKQRHNLSIKVPQSVEYARKKNVDPFLIYGYFDLLEKTITELGLENKPSQIWNLDETSFCADPSKTKIVGQRGLPATRTTSGPGKQNTTILMGCSAAGQKAPPLIIFKGKNVWDQWVAPQGTAYPNTTYAATSNGWMETSVFKNYFQKSFLKCIGKERPVLVIYDGHATHLGVEVIQTAIENGITILKLPSHTSHILQPLDLSVFKSLKSRWDRKLVDWQRRNVGVKIPKKEFSKLIGEIWTETTPDVLISGFVKAGICPVCRDVVPRVSFNPVALKRWENQHSVNSTSQPTTESPIQITIPNIPNASYHNNNHRSNLPHENATSETIDTVDDSLPAQDAATSTTFQELADRPSTSQLGAGPRLSFEELLLNLTRRKGNDELNTPKRKRVCPGAEVVTQADVQQLIENEQKKKRSTKTSKLKGKKTEVNKKIKQVELTSDEDELESWKSDPSEDRISEFDELSDNDEECADELVTDKDENEILQLQAGDYVLVKFMGKRKIYKYVCVITNLCDDEAEVTCLRKTKNNQEFRLDENDKSSIVLSDIEEKLKVPKVVTIGGREIYVFDAPVNVLEQI